MKKQTPNDIKQIGISKKKKKIKENKGIKIKDTLPVSIPKIEEY